MTGGGDAIAIVQLDGGPVLDLVVGDGEARAPIWPGMGARLRSMHRIALGPGARTVPQRHRSDAVYYVVEGAGEVAEPGGPAQPLVAGAMFHVDAGTSYVIRAGAAPLELVGGPAPPDPDSYARA